MNKNLRRKLIISGITLGVAAFATTASTYAWFTSTSSVKANNVTATVDKATGLYIAGKGTTGDYTNFGTSVDISEVVASEIGTLKMKPLQLKKEDNTLAYLGGSTANWIGNAATAQQDFLEFNLMFQGTDDLDVCINGVTAQPTTGIEKFTLKADAFTSPDTSTTHWGQGDQIEVDVLEALYFAITVGESTKLYQYSDDGGMYESKSYDAIAYYNNVMNGQTDKEQLPTDGNAANVVSTEGNTLKEASTTNITLGTISSNKLEVNVKVFLNGWDVDCFDAISSQIFKVSFSFGTVND